jgi:hypothetical protein
LLEGIEVEYNFHLEKRLRMTTPKSGSKSEYPTEPKMLEQMESEFSVQLIEKSSSFTVRLSDANDHAVFTTDPRVSRTEAIQSAYDWFIMTCEGI